MEVRGTAYKATHASNRIPIGTTVLAGYPSRIVPSNAGGSLNILMAASKRQKATIKPLMMRPAQSFFLEVGASEVEAGTVCTAECIEQSFLLSEHASPGWAASSSPGLLWITTLDRRQAGNLHHRPDFDRTLACGRNPACNVDGIVEILGLDHVVAAKLFAGLREWAVGYQSLAIAYLDAGRSRNWLQRRGTHKLATRLERMGKLRGLAVTLLALSVGPGLLVAIDQQHVLHWLPPLVSRTADGQIDIQQKYF